MRIRKPLFITFLVAYVALLPFLISYALGYDLIAITKGKLVRTGGIFVTSTPSRARLLIDASEPPRRTPGLGYLAAFRHAPYLTRHGRVSSLVATRDHPSRRSDGRG